MLSGELGRKLGAEGCSATSAVAPSCSVPLCATDRFAHLCTASVVLFWPLGWPPGERHQGESLSSKSGREVAARLSSSTPRHGPRDPRRTAEPRSCCISLRALTATLFKHLEPFALPICHFLSLWTCFWVCHMTFLDGASAKKVSTVTGM